MDDPLLGPPDPRDVRVSFDDGRRDGDGIMFRATVEDDTDAADCQVQCHVSGSVASGISEVEEALGRYINLVCRRSIA
jgi:hypothetical protein